MINAINIAQSAQIVLVQIEIPDVYYIFPNHMKEMFLKLIKTCIWVKVNPKSIIKTYFSNKSVFCDKPLKIYWSLETGFHLNDISLSALKLNLKHNLYFKTKFHWNSSFDCIENIRKIYVKWTKFKSYLLFFCRKLPFIQSLWLIRMEWSAQPLVIIHEL